MFSMNCGHDLMKNGLRKLAEWAETYVDCETAISEKKNENLTDDEKSALLLINLIKNIR
jgi:hypothetical protein